MKAILLPLIVLFSINVQAENLRDICENAYYATGYVKLHEYKLTIDWSYVSDNNLKLLEDVIYGDHFKVTKETDKGQKTFYELKEINAFDSVDYEADINLLKKISLNKIECLYDL